MSPPKLVAKGVYYLGTYGTPEIVSSYLAVGSQIVLLEPGPTCIVGDLLHDIESLGIEPNEIDYVFVSHIHLDHAGGAWKVLELAPRAKLLVSQKGAKHMVDPSRLVESARAVLGDEVLNYYGDVKPINADRVVPLKGGERIDLGGPKVRIVATYGHSPHHVSAFEEASKSIVTGDAVGNYYRDIDALVPASAPPSFDLELAIESIQTILDLEPRFLLLPHFGVIDASLEFLENNLRTYRLWEKHISYVMSKHGDERDAYSQLLKIFSTYRRLSEKADRFGNLFVDIRGFMQYMLSKRSTP